MPRIRAGWFLPVAGTHRMRPQNQTREGLQIVHGGTTMMTANGANYANLYRLMRRPVGANNYSPLRFGYRMYVASVETLRATSLQLSRDLPRQCLATARTPDGVRWHGWMRKRWRGLQIVHGGAAHLLGVGLVVIGKADHGGMLTMIFYCWIYIAFPERFFEVVGMKTP